MSDLINGDDNEKINFERIFFQVQNQMQIFEQETQSIWQGFKKIQKIHGDIISNFESTSINIQQYLKSSCV